MNHRWPQFATRSLKIKGNLFLIGTVRHALSRRQWAFKAYVCDTGIGEELCRLYYLRVCGITLQLWSPIKETR